MRPTTMRCERVRRARPLLGTLVEISLSGNDANALHDAASAAFEVIASVHEIMSFQSSDSDVSRLNNSAVGCAVQIDPRTWRVIQVANSISWASGGAFDIAVGGEMMARGELPVMASPPADRDASYRDIELLADSRVRMRRPLAIDVGGIAKGYAVDCAVKVLQEMSVGSGCVNAGGDLRVFGDESVPVDVRDPLDPTVSGACASVRDSALATSANYPAGAGFDSAGVVLDPRGDAPVVGGRSASVRAKSCMIADALAKCVLLLEQGSAKLLQHYHAEGFMLGRNGSVVIDTELYETQSRAKAQFTGKTKSAGAFPPAERAVNSKSMRTSASNTDLVDVDLVGTAG